MTDVETMKRLYAEQVAYAASNPGVGAPSSEDAVEGFPFMSYLDHKFSLDIIVEREIRIVEMVMPYVRGRILDWGCHYGHACCIFRKKLGDTLELYGCDVFNEYAYRPFYEYSGMLYTRIKHPYLLPYHDAFFDAVLSNGVLEHVPHERESVREIHRILKPGGLFIITALPNKLSYTEAMSRALKATIHDRLYSVDSARTMLAAEGFRLIASKYFFVLPTMLGVLPSGVRRVYSQSRVAVQILNRVLELIWPLNRISSSLMVVAAKLERET